MKRFNAAAKKSTKRIKPLYRSKEFLLDEAVSRPKKDTGHFSRAASAQTATVLIKPNKLTSLEILTDTKQEVSV